MRFRFLFFLLPVLLPLTLLCQDKRAIDSLQLVLKTAKDTVRVNTLISLCSEVHNDDPGEGIRYAKDAIVLADQLHFNNGYFFANMALAVTYYGSGNLDSALAYFNVAKKTGEEQNDFSKLTSVNMNIGNIYGDLGQNRKCIEYYLIAADYAEKINNPEKGAYIRMNIGTVYSALEQYDSALFYYQLAQGVLKKIDVNHSKLPIVYNNIGATYLVLKDTLKAESNFKEAMRVATARNNRRGLASSYEHLGVILYFNHHLTDSAIALEQLSISMYETTGSKSGLIEARMHLGEIYSREKKYDEALLCLEAGLKLAEEQNDNYNLKQYYNLLSGIYEAKQEPVVALAYYKKLMAVKDTIYNLSSSSIVSEMKTQLANEKNEREIETLNAKSDRQNIIIYSVVGMGILLLLLAVLIFNRYLVKKRAGDLLSRQNEEIQKQKNIIEEKNKDITDSIRYAQRIQNSHLPPELYIDRSLKRLRKG